MGGGLLLLFVKGGVLGLSLAASVGPMSLICLRTTLAHGFAVGALAGLGIAAADVAYAAVAAFGLTAVTAFLTGEQGWLMLAGGLYLVWFGLSTLLRPPKIGAAPAERAAGLKAFTTCFLLTLANPPTILIFTAMLAGLGLAEAPQGGLAALSVVAGVLLGSGGWYLLFAGVVAFARERVTGRPLRWINGVSGAALAGLGMWAVAGAARRLFAGA